METITIMIIITMGSFYVALFFAVTNSVRFAKTVFLHLKNQHLQYKKIPTR